LLQLGRDSKRWRLSPRTFSSDKCIRTADFKLGKITAFFVTVARNAFKSLKWNLDNNKNQGEVRGEW
jgi:hypothetical protein